MEDNKKFILNFNSGNNNLRNGLADEKEKIQQRKNLETGEIEFRPAFKFSFKHTNYFRATDKSPIYVDGKLPQEIDRSELFMELKLIPKRKFSFVHEIIFVFGNNILKSTSLIPSDKSVFRVLIISIKNQFNFRALDLAAEKFRARAASPPRTNTRGRYPAPK